MKEIEFSLTYSCHRSCRGLAKLAARKQLKLDIKAKPPGTRGFTPIGPLWRVEHAFAQLGRWRRLARCYEGSEASAKAWAGGGVDGVPARAGLTGTYSSAARTS